MIVLFTDYGLEGPYIGQVEAVLHQLAPREKVINLLADAPRQNPKACAYLLAALTRNFPAGTIFFCVVDPGVGSFRDRPVALNIDQSWYVGPDNGLFDIVTRRGKQAECREITWRRAGMSASFHGRDLYAPICAMIASGNPLAMARSDWRDRHHWPDDLDEVIYIDHFGNCMTGIGAGKASKDLILKTGRKEIAYAATFSDAPEGELFWYINSCDLVEIAVNRGNAREAAGLSIGSRIAFV